MSVKLCNSHNAKAWYAKLNANKEARSLIESSKAHSFVRSGLITDEELEDVELIDNFVLQILGNKSHEAAMQWKEFSGNKTCILNFASFFNPGGGFLRGAGAQEESLCHASALYPILKESPFYEDRKKLDVPPEYLSEVIYTPDVPFYKDYNPVNPVMCDVISCAAPNLNRARNLDADHYGEILSERLKLIFEVPLLNGCNSLVVGAWGCGVFGNDYHIILPAMLDAINAYSKFYRTVIIALPNREHLEFMTELASSVYRSTT